MRARAGAARLLSLLLPVSIAMMTVLSSGCGGRSATRPAAGPPSKPPRISGRPGAVPPAPDAGGEVASLGDQAEITAEEIADEETGAGPGEEPERAAPPRPVQHYLERGQTLYSLARVYGVPLDVLMRANRITDPTVIAAGTPILIPGAERARPYRSSPSLASSAPRIGPPAPPRTGPPAATRIGPPAPPGAIPPASPGATAPAPQRAMPPATSGPGTPDLQWPLRGSITSAFGTRGHHAHHQGLDIDGDLGDAVFAAAAGTVIEAGTEREYGKMVILDHGGGLTTLYAHASRLLVRAGQPVRRGELIARVGRTGNARGTHLHFEVRRDGRPVNPLPLLQTRLTTASAQDGSAGRKSISR